MGQQKSLFPLALGPVEAKVLALLTAARHVDETDLATGTQPGSDELILIARRIYESRRDRDRFFDGELFSEPAWDMLLAAYSLPTADRPLTVSGLCHASAVPPTTGLRWIEYLVEVGMLKRQPSNNDRRVSNISLTPSARAQIDAYLTRINTRLHLVFNCQPTGRDAT